MTGQSPVTLCLSMMALPVHPDDAMPLTWITEGGQRLLLNDFSNQTDDVSIHQLDAQLRVLLSQHTAVRMLIDVTGVSFSKELLLKTKLLAREAERHLDRQAIIGVTPAGEFKLRAFNMMEVGVPLRPFATRAEALRYLVG